MLLCLYPCKKYCNGLYSFVLVWKMTLFESIASCKSSCLSVPLIYIIKAGGAALLLLSTERVLQVWQRV